MKKNKKYFDGQSDYFAIPDGNWTFPKGNFTINVDVKLKNIKDLKKISLMFNRMRKKRKYKNSK